MKTILSSLLSFLLAGCVGYPKTVVPVQDFDINRYLGRWYEIARLDHSFERGLEQVTADYSLRKDGGVSVKNRGYSSDTNQWKEAKGRAYFVREKTEGYLKVSFFGPFYGAYVVFELDRKNYQYAFVSGPNRSYLWLLSRTPTVSEPVKQVFIQRAEELGYPVDELMFVKHK